MAGSNAVNGYKDLGSPYPDGVESGRLWFGGQKGGWLRFRYRLLSDRVPVIAGTPPSFPELDWVPSNGWTRVLDSHRGLCTNIPLMWTFGLGFGWATFWQHIIVTQGHWFFF